MRTIVLLICSNVFMTVAWYGHLKFKGARIWVVILLSWLIALPEYALQVPANRYGHGTFSAPQLKIIQEVISICVFLVFSVLALREWPRWNDWLALCLILGAVLVAFYPRWMEERQAGQESAGGSSAVEAAAAPVAPAAADVPEVSES